MAKKIKIKTQKNNLSVTSYINHIQDDQLRLDCKVLIGIFKKVTKKKAKMWGPSIVGFGETTYHRSNGDYGYMPALAFSPRKSGPVLYIKMGFPELKNLLKEIGPHKISKACLYFKSLKNIDLKTLEKLILASYKELKKANSIR